MGRKADLSDDEKSSIRTLVEQGYQFKQIGIILKRDSTAVSKYWNKYNNESISKRTGRKRSYSEADERQILWAGSNQITSAKRIKSDLALPQSDRTVRRILSKSPNLSYTNMTKVPYTSAKISKDRLAWAKDKKNWIDEWKDVIFSDEKKFNLDGPDHIKYWHDKRKPKLRKPVRQGGGKSVMFWAGFGYHGKLPIKEMVGRQDSIKYQLVLEECLLPTAVATGGTNWKFLQDGASIHRSKSTNIWCKSNNIALIPWASYSPDMNPMENVWSHLCTIIYVGGKTYNDLLSLKRAIADAWTSMSQEYLQTLINSMNHRVEALIEAKGGDTAH
jgi:hypothetical protein